MMFPAFWSELWTARLINHLWQSTLVVGVAWLLTLALRGNQARTRYWVWMIASVKFLLPFWLLVAAGEWLRTALVAPIARPGLAMVMEQVTEPFPQTAWASAERVGHSSWVSAQPSHLAPGILAALWLGGFIAIAWSWGRGWWQIRAAVRASSQIERVAGIPILSSPRRLEPGVFGIFRPVLLLPENIKARLSAAQLAAIVAHELHHVRRPDNLPAAIHMLVEATFWFHPVVWWIKARLLEERERACVEAVLGSGSEAQLYAESILNVCKFYVEPSIACMAGVTGSDLKRRIVRI